jgi:chorismate dehydratase
LSAEISSRFGSVPYLNARPLIESIGGQLKLLVPSELADVFAAGGLDAALLPVYEAVAHEHATIVDDVAIACRGEVFSVFLAHREPIGKLETIALDPASHTSNKLLQCLFAEFLGLEPDYVSAPQEEFQARLLIGDAALKFRETQSGWEFLDLGAEWMKWTGLPFVFACWVLREGVDDPARLAEGLREVKQRGLEARPRIASEFANTKFVERYLTEYIRYDLRDEEKQAIALFAALLRKHGLVGTSAESVIRYV